MLANRQAFEQPHVTIKVKNKFINLLFVNRQIQEVTYHKTIICFLSVFIVFGAFSIFFFVEVSKVVEIREQYYSRAEDNKCLINSKCQVSFQVESYMKQPIYFMYQIGKSCFIVGNFYQNHRRYIQSKNNYQLAGNQINKAQAISCSPYITNSEMKVTKSWGNVDLDPNAVASPCGSVALTYFNDTFQIYKASNRIAINEQGISWNGDKGGKYRRGPNSSALQWIDPQDEHFIVWMRTSGLPNFKKPWGKIQVDLEPGEYVVKINNNYNSKQWNGNRYFYLTTLSLIGAKNYLLPITFSLISVCSLIATIFFWKRFRMLRNIARRNS